MKPMKRTGGTAPLHDHKNVNGTRAGNRRTTAREPSPAAPPTQLHGLPGLQATVGNAAVVQMLRKAGHPWAQENHRHAPGCGHRQDEHAAPDVQRSTVHDVLRTPGRPMSDAARADMETRLGADFSDVRIHDDSAAKASAAEVGARAYTSGNHIVVGDGGADEHTLAHELTHVIQQRQGPVAGTDNGAGLKVSDPSDRFEREAEANARRVLSGAGPVHHAEVAGSNSTAGGHIQRVLTNAGGQELHDPQVPPNYTYPRDWDSKVADRKGRDDGDWRYASHNIPGLNSKTTSTPNKVLIAEQRQAGNWQQVLDSFYQVCPGCGNAADVEIFEVDHQQALSEIRKTLFELADEYTRTGVYRIPAQYQEYFVSTQVTRSLHAPSGVEFQPSKAVVHKFSHDTDNLMRICRTCNGAVGKSDTFFLKWFEESKFFGKPFLAKNLTPQGSVHPSHILAKTKNEEGWGAAARDWFETQHLPTLKQQTESLKLHKATTKDLSDESTVRVEGMHHAQNGDPRLAYNMMAEADRLSRRNKANLGIVTAVTENVEKAPDYEPGSPDRLAAQVKNVFDSRNTRKFEESMEATWGPRMSESGARSMGMQDGFSMAPPDHTKIPPNRSGESEQLLRAYMEGYAQGMRQLADMNRMHASMNAL